MKVVVLRMCGARARANGASAGGSTSRFFVPSLPLMFSPRSRDITDLRTTNRALLLYLTYLTYLIKIPTLLRAYPATPQTATNKASPKKKKKRKEKIKLFKTARPSTTANHHPCSSCSSNSPSKMLHARTHARTHARSHRLESALSVVGRLVIHSIMYLMYSCTHVHLDL
ncbi:hypothetical protein IWX49DRAFT_428016 [Phyllosticta citricarpa]